MTVSLSVSRSAVSVRRAEPTHDATTRPLFAPNTYVLALFDNWKWIRSLPTNWLRIKTVMNRHQVLTGAVNSGDDCYAIGSVEGIHFTVSPIPRQYMSTKPTAVSVLK